MKTNKPDQKQPADAPVDPSAEEEFPNGIYQVRGAMVSDIQVSRPPFEIRKSSPTPKSPSAPGK